MNFEELNNKIERKQEFNNWVKADISKEAGEFERVIQNFYPNLISHEEIINFIKNEYETIEPVELDNITWQYLENTDSSSIAVNDFEKIKEIANQVGRDYESILNGLRNNSEMERPIIIQIPGENPHLVSGNTRLCLSKVLNIIPEVYILRMHKFATNS